MPRTVVATILLDHEDVYAFRRARLYLVGGAFRSGSRIGARDAKEQPWSVDGPRWVVRAESKRDAALVVANAHADELARWSFTDDQQRVLYVANVDDILGVSPGTRWPTDLTTDDGQQTLPFLDL